MESIRRQEGKCPMLSMWFSISERAALFAALMPQ